ncbi:MAG: CPBP family intramembrane metalloprotease [Actinomycetales bacterium]|nr:CPBP family intramembrane metalloprotease [Actinomycetales bacterium]
MAVPRDPVEAPHPRVPWAAVGVFTALAVGLAWLVTLPLWLPGADGVRPGLANPWFTLLAVGMMATPTVSALVVMLAMARPRSIPRRLGMWPLRPVPRLLLFSLLALVGIPLLCALSMLLGAALGLLHLVPPAQSALGEQLAGAGMAGDPGALTALIAVQLAVIPVNAVFSSLAAMLEEFGWRGWLLPALRPLGAWPALLITGAIWGVWHAPLILLGYNYGLTDLRGVLAMTVFTVLFGVVIGWMRLRSASVWPAAFAHGALNTATGTLLLSFVASDEVGSAIWGSILGFSGWIVLGVVIAVLALTRQLGKQPVAGLPLGAAAPSVSAAASTAPSRGEANHEGIPT